MAYRIRTTVICDECTNESFQASVECQRANLLQAKKNALAEGWKDIKMPGIIHTICPNCLKKRTKTK